MMIDMRSRFITIEGGEGSGKSSAIYEIQKFFEEKGYKVLISREYKISASTVPHTACAKLKGSPDRAWVKPP